MTRSKGFTLIELMVVILIVAILAAVLVPLMRGRIDAAKWSEANAACAQIRTAVRAYVAEKGPDFNYASVTLTGGHASWGTTIGITTEDLTGRYFLPASYNIDSVDTTDGSPTFGQCAITVTASASGASSGGPPSNPASMTMTITGDWIAN